MDCIKITQLEIFAHHGVFEEETRNGQHFYANLKLYFPMEEAARTDELEKSVHYGEVCEFLTQYLTENTFQLLEAAVSHSMKAVMLRFPRIEKMEMELCKPEAPISLPFENVSVTMTRRWHRTYIALGSNLGEKESTIENAIQIIKEDDNFRKIRQSALIVTKPYGMTEQPDFVNGMLEAETLLTPLPLLDRLHEIEKAAGRERNIHWGPRTLDLDIIYYDELVMNTENLIIPHVDMANRDFVLKPLTELAPYYRHPIYQLTSEQLFLQLQNR